MVGRWLTRSEVRSLVRSRARTRDFILSLTSNRFRAQLPTYAQISETRFLTRNPRVASFASPLQTTKNRGMRVTPEVIGTIVAIISAAGLVFGGNYRLMRNMEFRMTQRSDERFDQVDRRFGRVDRRLEQVDKRFEQVDKRFEQVDKRFEWVSKQFEQVDKQFEQLRGELRVVRDDLRTLTVDVAAFQVSVARLEGPQPRLLRAP